MEPPTTTVFAPDLGDVYTAMVLCGLGFIALVFVAFRLGKIDSPDPRKKVLLPMLAYFMALLTLMGFLGSSWSLFKYPTVELTPTAFIVDGNTFPKPRPNEFRLESYASSGLGDGGRVLLVQIKDRKTLAFPEDRYPINQMIRLLKPKQ